MGSQLCGMRGSHQELEKQLLQKPQIQKFLSRYPLIAQKFNLHPKYLPQPSFQSLTKNKNSILFKSAFILDHPCSPRIPFFPGIIFQENVEDSEQNKSPCKALCYQGRFDEFEAKNGTGFAIFDNGDIYEGQWKDNLFDGNGIYTQHQNKTIYEGCFSHGKKQGKGKMICKIDRKYTYEGDFRSDQINGKGRMHYEDGSQYEGQFRNGVQEGYGVYKTATMKYEGTWKGGLMSGSGSAVWYSEKGEVLSKYTGQYDAGKKHGFGQYEGKKGKLLRGQWFEGKFNLGANSYIIE